MNRNRQDSERGPWDFIMFGVVFWSFVLTVAGVVTSSIGMAVTGLIGMGLGLVYYGIQEWLSD